MEHNQILTLLKSIGVDSYQEYSNLPDEARAEVDRILSEMAAAGESVRLNEIYREDFIMVPPTPEEFLTDKYFVGEMARYLYPRWREELLYVLDRKNGIAEWIISGAIGTGKSFASTFAQAYKLCYLSCLRNPQQYCGLAENTSIVFSVFNLTIEKTEITLYNDLKNLLNSSPFFREKFPLKTVYGSGGREKEVAMPKNIFLISGSKAVHAMSTNVFSCILDEMNFRDNKNTRISYSDQSEAFKLYTAIHRRVTSRYVGFSPGLLCMISSRQTITDFLEEHIEKSRSLPHVHISEFSLYKIKPAISFPSGETFDMLIGDRAHYRTSRVLEPGETLPQDARVERGIPRELLSDALLDPDGFVRDVIGAATFPSSPLISVKEALGDCIDGSRQHPFQAQSLVISTTSPEKIQDFFDRYRLAKVDRGAIHSPHVRPAAPRVVGVDLSSTGDSTGMAMGFAYEIREQAYKRRDPYTMAEKDVLIPRMFLYFDLFLEITPPRRGKGEIDFDKVEDFIVYLRDDMKFNIALVSFDGWQSFHMRQRLEKKGFKAIIHSVDKDDRSYLELKQLIQERRCSFYKYEPFEEIEFLQHYVAKKKVDHLKGKKKDVCDAAAAVAFHCSQLKMAQPMQPPDSRAAISHSMFKGTPVGNMDDVTPIIKGYAPNVTRHPKKKREIISVGTDYGDN